MIRFEQVGKRYPNGHVGLHELSFRVRRGEFLFVTGHSGAGKSTLLRLLLAMERPTSGKLLLAGQDLGQISNAQIPFLRRQIGVVFQNHQLLFDRTVFNNVALPLQILGLSKAEVAKRVDSAVSKTCNVSPHIPWSDFKKIYDSVAAYRADQYFWWQVAEYSFDTFQIRARSRG